MKMTTLTDAELDTLVEKLDQETCPRLTMLFHGYHCAEKHTSDKLRTCPYKNTFEYIITERGTLLYECDFYMTQVIKFKRD